MELTTAMLADAAHLAQGKLYVLGGQWDRIAASQIPARHPTMAVVLVFKVEYTEALSTMSMNVELMLDGDPVGPKAIGQLSVGHAPGLKRGAPQFTPAAITFNNVQFDKAARYEWVVSVDDKVLGHIPLDVVRNMTIQVPAAGSGTPPSS